MWYNSKAGFNDKADLLYYITECVTAVVSTKNDINLIFQLSWEYKSICVVYKISWHLIREGL